MAIISSRLAPSLDAASSKSSAHTGYQLRRAGSPNPPTLKGSISRNLSRERSIRFVRPLQQEPRRRSERWMLDATGIQAPTPACPNRCAVSAKLTAAKYKSDTAVNVESRPWSRTARRSAGWQPASRCPFAAHSLAAGHPGRPNHDVWMIRASRSIPMSVRAKPVESSGSTKPAAEGNIAHRWPAMVLLRKLTCRHVPERLARGPPA
jgi:hypothetical protein